MMRFAPLVGQPLALRPDLALVLAPNPSPMTGMGTNSYLLGRDRLLVIDPGPDDPRHLDALQQAIAGRAVDHILVTHAHLDHSALASALARATGAPVCAFGDATAGRSAVMTALVAQGLQGGGEGVDLGFQPDITLADGASIASDCGPIRAMHTPGHMGNHLCFHWQDMLFCGDHVMDWASTLVSPPDGDVTDFLTSCTRLRDADAAVFYPAHGAPVTDPAARLDWLIAHRKAREAQILHGLQQGPGTVAELTAQIYSDLGADLQLAARRNVLAHLIALVTKGAVTATPGLSAGAVFALQAPAKDAPESF
jgi:glyoxylase-like metal-dependent hydrolase (beta-lactamase superfamily II)